MRGLFRWAHNAKLVKVDPTAGVSNPKRKGTDGFVPWTEADMTAYETRWPIGTRQRVWLDVLAYTGLRRGDVVRLGRQHVRDGAATIKTEKSKFTVEVALPILPVLAETLAAGPTGDLAFICGERGNPLTKEASAICSRTRARPLAFPAQRTASGRLQRPAQPTTAQPRLS
jgi:integrase